MQPVCPSGKRKLIQFGSKVEVTKMRIKTCHVHCFKEYLNKRAVNPILELDKGNISTLVNFKY